MSEFVTIVESKSELVPVDLPSGVAVLRLDRPKVNALNLQLSEELRQAAIELEGRSDIRAVVVWGGPKIFAAGADIAAFPIGEGHRDPSDMVDPLNEALLRLEALPQVTVSAVNGVALGGGCELSMATDFRVCGESSNFGQPEILLGIIPGAGGTQRLTRLVGMTKSKEIGYTGRMVPAAEAVEIGLASAMFPDDDVLAGAIDMVAPFVNGPAAIANVKRSIQDGHSLAIADAIEVEKREFVASFQTDDAVIGIQSFLENGPGKATFTGK